MRKRGLCLLIGFLLISGIVMAAENESESTGFEKGYVCLENLVKDKKDLSLQEAVFSTLALGSLDNLDKIINDNKNKNSECWPAKDCKLKETAQVLLAYDRIGENTDKIKKWLLDQRITPSELTWYLEIDISNHVPAECKVKYDGREYTINIGSDMKLSDGGGRCLSRESNGYWLAIDNSCLNKVFSVTCKEDFISAILYKWNLGDTIYVSSKANSAVSLGTTEESVNASCFKNPGNTKCDYEGTLWAAYALMKIGEKADNYLNYLSALASENKKYFPSAILYILSAKEDYYSDIVLQQKQNKFWEITGSPYNRYYDTSLALLGLGSSSSAEAEQARKYLESIQSKSGCWNNDNIRDSAFILYSAWKKEGIRGVGGNTPASCTGAGYSCELVSSCESAKGQIYYSYSCPSGNEFCCSVKVQEKTCAEKGGLICSLSQKCSGVTSSASDGSCCMGACQVVEEKNACEVFGKTCRLNCNSDENKVDYSCEGDKICCEFSSSASTETTSSSAWWWIILLLILIILVVLGIIYRSKLQVLWFKLRKGGGTGVVGSGRSGPGSGGSVVTRAVPFGFIRPQQRTQAPITRVVKPGPTRENEMDSVMRKLREMGR